MRNWPVQDAKARFGELLQTCLQQGPQFVTKRGEEVAVLVPIEQWRRFKQVERPGLKALLLEYKGRGELALPVRGQGKPGRFGAVEFDKIVHGWLLGVYFKLRWARWQMRTVAGLGRFWLQFLQTPRTQSGWSLAASFSQLATESCT